MPPQRVPQEGWPSILGGRLGSWGLWGHTRGHSGYLEGAGRKQDGWLPGTSSDPQQAVPPDPQSIPAAAPPGPGRVPSSQQSHLTRLQGPTGWG